MTDADSLLEIGRLRAENKRLLDKIDGLEADLHSAVNVAFMRGATEWARLNYPGWFSEHPE